MKYIKNYDSFDINEGFHWILNIAAAYFFYRFIKGILKDNMTKKLSKMSSAEKEDYEKRKLDSHNYSILLYYIKDYIKEGGEVKFDEDYLYYNFRLNDLVIKIDKNKNVIFWNHIKADVKSIGKWKVGDRVEQTDIGYEKHPFIEPIPISEEEIKGLVDAIQEEQN